MSEKLHIRFSSQGCMFTVNGPEFDQVLCKVAGRIIPPVNVIEIYLEG